MDNISYYTTIIVDGYVDVHKYGTLYFVIMFSVYILIIYSNLLIVYTIWTCPNLHEPMYIFIAALCVNAVTYSTTIYPKFLIDVLSEKQVISFVACLFQWFTYYNFGCTEFLLLMVMAYDRYVSICKPLKYYILMRKNKVMLFIALAYLIPIIEAIGPLVENARRNLCHSVFNGIVCNSMVHRLYCVPSKELTFYGMFVLATVLIFPVLFIIFTYLKIFYIARRSKEMKRKAAETCLPHLLVLINFTIFGTYDVLLLRIETEFSKTVRFFVTIQTMIYHPLFNPLIYGLKMKEINKNIKKLFSSFRKFK